MPRTMDARNEWNRARKRMKEFGVARVSSCTVARSWMGFRNTKRKTLREEVTGGKVNALEAIARKGMKQVLKPVVEVQYTTDKLGVAR